MNDATYDALTRFFDFCRTFFLGIVDFTSKVYSFLLTPVKSLVQEIDWLPDTVANLLSRIMPDISVIQMVLSAGVTFFLVFTLIKWFTAVIP